MGPWGPRAPRGGHRHVLGQCPASHRWRSRQGSGAPRALGRGWGSAGGTCSGPVPGERGFNRGLVHSKLLGGVCAASARGPPAPVTLVYVSRGGGGERAGHMADGWHSRGCGRCRDPDVFGEASRAANGPALQLGAIKPDRCVAGGGGLHGGAVGGGNSQLNLTQMFGERGGRARGRIHPGCCRGAGGGRLGAGGADAWGFPSPGRPLALTPVPKSIAQGRGGGPAVVPGRSSLPSSSRAPAVRQGELSTAGPFLALCCVSSCRPPGLRAHGGGCCGSAAGGCVGALVEAAAGLWSGRLRVCTWRRLQGSV